MRVATVAFLLAWAVPVAAGDDPRWYAAVQLGSARIHPWDERGSWGEGRIGRRLGAAKIVSVDLGIAGSGSGEGFFTVTPGLELRPWPRARLSPFFRAEVGLLGEPEFGGFVAGAGGGLTMRLTPRLGLRGGATWSRHGGETGPVTYYGGLGYSW